MRHFASSKKIAWRSFLIVMLMIFLIETMIMILFHTLASDNVWLEVFADPIVLILFLFPSIYIFILRPMEREINIREQAERELQEANNQAELRVKQRTAELETANAELERRNQEARILTEMSDLLQSCTTLDEAYRTIRQIAPRLFPSFGGALYMYSPSRDDLEAVITWGDLPQEQKTRIFEPVKCWALRRGRLHIIDNLCDGAPCHSQSPALAGACAPLIAQGESLGVLYLREKNDGAPLPFNEQLAITTSEQIAPALANLRMRDTLRNQAIRDPLTGLFNRRFMEETLTREIRRSERNQRELNILMFDLDHFKQFNDTFGHEAGDALLRELGQLLIAGIRGGDVACRFGGEEFVLIMPETTLENAKQRADELCEKTRQLIVTYRGQALGIVTVSIGVAAYPKHGMTGEALLRAADKALYQAKAEGRDRVVVAEFL